MIADSTEPAPGAVPPPDERVNILLVDDQPGKLIAHEAILAELGQNVVKATNGREALECLLRQDFAVILLDVRMPDMDGFETAGLIRQRPRFERTPIIFITAYNTNDMDRLKGYSLGAVDYLFLPVIPEVLKAKVRVFVELARQTQIIKRQAENLAEHNQAQARQLETIQQLNRELREANEELETFSYTISHDLRAPLRALKGYSEMLLEDYSASLDATAQGCLTRIRAAACHLDALTRDLLAYTRVVREPIQLKRIEPEKVLQEIVSMNPALQSPAAEVTIGARLLPVQAHASLLGHCLANLLDNATKFVTPGHVPRIEVHTELRGSRVRLCVRDNGVGIDPAFHHKIFGIFERVGDVKKYDGTGIGLAIVARAAQRMGGTCGVESTMGQGSQFWVELSSA